MKIMLNDRSGASCCPIDVMIVLCVVPLRLCSLGPRRCCPMRLSHSLNHLWVTVSVAQLPFVASVKLLGQTWMAVVGSRRHHRGTPALFLLRLVGRQCAVPRISRGRAIGYCPQLLILFRAMMFLTNEYKTALPNPFRFRGNSGDKKLLITLLLSPHLITSGCHQILKASLPL